MNTNKLHEFINSQKGDSIEIECRFNEMGMFGVTYDTFKNVHKRLTHDKNFKSAQPVRTAVYTMKHKKSNDEFRLTQYTNKKSTFEKKTKIANLDIKPYNIRLASSREEQLNVSNSDLKSMYNVTFVRYKTRYSFTNDSSSIDLTHVVQNRNEKKYEIECELKDVNKTRDFVNTVITILKYLQSSDFIISNDDKKELLDQYASLIQQKYAKFIGPLPHTISKAEFETGILSCNYSVTDKADGLRKLLFINSQGKSLLIGRANGNALITGSIYVGTIGQKNTVYDGELIELIPGKYEYHIFDCVYSNGDDVRNLDLISRLKLVNTTKSPGSSSSSSIKRSPKFKSSIGLYKKKFYVNDNESMYTHAYKLWENKGNKPYTLDGLIFTPIYTNYYNDSIYKWKPVDTFDFYIVKTSGNTSHETWTLNIAGFDKRNNYAHYTFRGFDGRGTFSYKKQGRHMTIKSLIPFQYGTVRIENSLASRFKNNTVIEFKFSTQQSKFIPLQTREDKKFANGILAVNDAYTSLMNPITHSMLRNGKYVFCGRKFHNAIKNDLIQKYVKKSKVLDIGVGAGGNIHKYKKANVSRLVGINIVPIEYNYNKTKMTFYHVKNTNFYNVQNILKKSNTKTFDNITCFFAIHYFFKNETYLQNLYKNVNNSLKQGGHFICTFMEDSSIKKLLKGSNKYESNVFDLKVNKEKLQVKLKGTKYFSKNSSKEFFVNVKQMMKVFVNFEIKEHTQFKNYCEKFPMECNIMNAEEKKFSFLNSSLVLQKKM